MRACGRALNGVVMWPSGLMDSTSEGSTGAMAKPTATSAVGAGVGEGADAVLVGEVGVDGDEERQPPAQTSVHTASIPTPPSPRLQRLRILRPFYWCSVSRGAAEPP